MVDTNEVESHLIDRYEIRRRLGKIFRSAGIELLRFYKISYFLERVLMKLIVQICSLESIFRFYMFD